LKKKHALLHIVKKLTNGVVGGSVNWSTSKSRPNLMKLVKRTKYENMPVDGAADDPKPYSLQEASSILLSSYDDLYMDETAETEVGDGTLPEIPIDIVCDPSLQSSLPNSNSSNNSTTLNTSVDGAEAMNGAMSDDYTSDSDHEQAQWLQNTDLYTDSKWQSYYSRLDDLDRAMKGQEGWSKFDAVFMISAVDGDGVLDVKVKCFFLFFVRYY